MLQILLQSTLLYQSLAGPKCSRHSLTSWLPGPCLAISEPFQHFTAESDIGGLAQGCLQGKQCWTDNLYNTQTSWYIKMIATIIKIKDCMSRLQIKKIIIINTVIFIPCCSMFRGYIKLNHTISHSCCTLTGPCYWRHVWWHQGATGNWPAVH